MKTQLKLLTTLLLIALTGSLLTACGSGSSGSPAQNPQDSRKPSPVPEQQETGNNTDTVKVTIHGKTPREFYDQFLFKTSGWCPNNLWFHFQVNNDALTLKKIENSETRLRATFKVALIDESTFYYVYEEDEVTPTSDTGAMSKSVYREENYDKYEITAEGNIKLGDLGVGKGIMYNKNPAMSFRFSKSDRENLEGSWVILSTVSANYGIIPGKKRMDICKN